MRHLIRGIAGAAALFAAFSSAHAQALGPQRQFLALEPYYEYARLDNGTASRTTLNGYGGRLWINLEPFHFIPHSSIALFTAYAPKQTTGNVSALHWGAEYDQYLVQRPLGGIIDPFVTVGGGRFRQRAQVGTQTITESRWTVEPGGGIRIPIPNRLELRFDAKDLIIFNARTGAVGTNRTTNNLLLQAAIGLTF